MNLLLSTKFMLSFFNFFCAAISTCRRSLPVYFGRAKIRRFVLLTKLLKKENLQKSVKTTLHLLFSVST